MHELHHYGRSHLIGAAASLVRFSAKKYVYQRKLHPLRPPTDLAEWHERLDRDGAVLIPNFIDRSRLRELTDSVPKPSDFTVSPEGDKALMYLDAHRIPSLRLFFEDPRLRALAQAHISNRAIPLRQTIGLKVARGYIPTFEVNYHIDSWKHRLKAFLYLHDVTESEAPTVYLRGSHKGWWRMWTEARIDRFYTVSPNGYGADAERFFLGSYWPHEVAQLRNDYGFSDLVCTGAAGSLLLFDGRGLHRATPLTGDRRLILNSYWIHEGQHN